MNNENFDKAKKEAVEMLKPLENGTQKVGAFLAKKRGDKVRLEADPHENSYLAKMVSAEDLFGLLDLMGLSAELNRSSQSDFDIYWKTCNMKEKLSDKKKTNNTCCGSASGEWYTCD